jgi:hypothetical protein
LKVRAKQNIILADGTFVKRGTILDDKVITERVRKYVDSEDLSGKEGKVMVLHELSYEEKRMFNGQPAWFPTTVRAGEVVERKLLSSCFKEGIDFVSEWDEKLRAKVRYEEAQEEQRLLQPDPMKTYEIGNVGGWSIR